MTLQRIPAEQANRIPEWTRGERLAKARRDAKLEQEHMAELFHVSKSAISSWENDVSQPRDLIGVISRWAGETGVSPAWLLGMQDQQQSRCSDVIDLRVIPGGGKSHETAGQLPLPMMLCAV